MRDRSQSLSIPKKRSKPRRRVAMPREEWDVSRIVSELKRLGTQRNVDGMARFGIRAKICYGVAKPSLDSLAKRIGMVDVSAEVTASQMENWVREFDNWDTCDGTCCHLFVFAKPAWEKALEWSARKNEFEKRAGFALVAYLAYRDKAAPDRPFKDFLEVIERGAGDDRNFVRKAVNWALRNIGKRNLVLNAAAIATAKRLHKSDLSVTRWIATDALRELRGDAVQQRLRRKGV
jgi:3-methyladenine DNA glycosylase AlkD